MQLMTWLWRLGTITTAIYAVIFLIDCGVHLHQGWSQGVRERDRILDARQDCSSGLLESDLMMERCVQVRALILPIPTHIAIHHTGQHLAAKMTSALQSMVLLTLLGGGLFLCVMRWIGPLTHHHPPSSSSSFQPWDHPDSTECNQKSKKHGNHNNNSDDGTGKIPRQPGGPPLSVVYQLAESRSLSMQPRNHTPRRVQRGARKKRFGSKRA